MQELNGVLEYLPERVKKSMAKLDVEQIEKLTEIRIRSGCPLALCFGNETYYLTDNGNLSPYYKGAIILCQKDTESTFLSLANKSVYAHEREIKNGFLTLTGGCRVGIGGVYSGAKLEKVTSLSIRIAREIENCAVSLLPFSLDGLLIAGPPASGKTTLLRDLIKQLSKSGKRVSVIDSRREISGGFDMGENTDILITEEKSRGAQMALRTLSPEIIAFDEIGNSAELNAVYDCLNAGVSVIVTAHAGKKEDFYNRKVLKLLLLSEAISNIALVKSVGAEIKIFKKLEVVSNAFA